jgi:positive regulator of sigma E activity
MENLALKTRLAVLWLFVAVTMSANTLLYLIVPGVIDEIRAGEVVGMQAEPGLLLTMAVMYYWVPLVMAVLSLTLKDRVNRWASIVFGVFYVGFILFELFMNVTTVAYPYVILMDTSAIVVAALIAWHAWKWT